MILVYITCKNKREAERISNALLKKKLIACANIFSSFSMYRWKGKIQNTQEYIIMAKTISKNFDKIKKIIKKIHSYEVPCILKINATSENKFLKWLLGELKNRERKL